MAHFHRIIYFSFVFIYFLSSLGCSATPEPNAAPDSVAEKLYKNALEDLEDSLYPEAIEGFTTVRTKYPYSKWARLSLLKIADAHLESGKFNQAVNTYRNFLKYYPKHQQSAYARLQIGNAYFDQIPGDWWFLPPSAEKDQANIRRAIQAYREMTAKFPNAEESKKARQRIKQCRYKLAEHELYVAKFYFQRSKFKGTALRVNYLLSNYGNLGLDAQALLLGAKAHIAQKELTAAQNKLNRIVEEFNELEEAQAALELLQGLASNFATEE